MSKTCVGLFAWLILATFANDLVAESGSSRARAIAELKRRGAVKTEPSKPATENRVWSVTLVDSAVSDDMLKLLEELPELRVLDIHTSPRPGIGSFNGSQVTSQGIRSLKKLIHLHSLTLVIDGTITDADLTILDKMPGLRSLRIGSQVPIGAITDQGFARLKQFTHLENLEVFGQQLTDSCLASLEGLDKLNELSLSLDWKNPSGASLKPLEGLRNLRVLVLSASDLPDNGLIHLEGLTQLQSLSIFSMRVTDRGIEHLSRLTDLRELSIYHVFAPMRVTDDGLKHLKTMTKLRSLKLGIAQLSDTGLRHLALLPQLEELDLGFISDDTHTSDGLAKLKRSLPRLKLKQ